MNNKPPICQARGRTGWLKVMVLAGMVCLGAWLFMRIHYGDSRAPLDVVPNRWRAVLALAGRDPVIKLEMTFNVLKTRPGRPALVRLFPEGTVFKNVQLDGAPYDPVKQGAWHYAAISGSGRFVLTTEIEIKPEHDAGITRLRIRKPDFVQSLLEVKSPKAWEVRVPGVHGKIVGNAAQGTHGILQLGLGDALTVEWREPRPEVERVGIPSVVPSVAWIIGERTLSANAVLDVDILGGPREQMTVLLPKGSSRVKLTGPAVRDFRLNENRLMIFFRDRFVGKIALALSFEVVRLPGDIVACPALEVEEGHAEAGGWIMVINDSPGLLLENRVAGLQETSDLDMPAPALGLARGKPLYFYRATTRGVEPVFDVVDRTPFPIIETIADRAEMFVVVQPGGEEITRIRYTVRNNSRQFLRLNLPAGAELFSVEVDNKSCSISRDGETHLVPLVKSIQTVGGLIPFPVEIVYCRQGARVRDDSSRIVDLPELPDVPVAAVKAVVFTPEAPAIREYRSSLVRGTRWMTQEDLDYGMGRRTAVISPAWIDRKLAGEYYALGIESYQENKLEDADQFLKGAGQYAGADTPILAQSKDIIENIRAGRGEVNAGANRTERAKVVTIQKGLARDNEQLQAQQEQLIAGGLANIDSGNEELGAELLKQADAVGAQLSRRSASQSRQKAVRRDYEEKLTLVEGERKKNEELQKKYVQLQKKVREIAKESANKPESDAKGKALARGMLSATAKRNMDVASVQAPEAYDEANRQDREVSAGAEAQHIKSRIAANAAPSKSAVKQTSSADSLKGRNTMLSAKVSALEEALSWTTTQPAQVSQQVDPEEVSRANSLIEKAERKLEAIGASLTCSDSATLADIAAEKELTNLVTWVDLNSNTFGTLDDKIKNDFSGLQARLKETGIQLENARKRRQEAEFVEVPLSGNGLENRSGREAFSRFLAFNYMPSEDKGRQLYRVGDRNLYVWNGEKVPEKLNKIVEKFTTNGGRVVSIGGTRLALALSKIPVVGNWFSARTGNGRRYAMLDEAQYRTLVQVSAFLQPRDDAGRSSVEQREVIVGTGNTLAGQNFKLLRTETDANTFAVDGTDIIVRHNQYLAIEDGDHLSVLKAGEVHDWQDDTRAVSMIASASVRIELPQTGTPVYFEKTLLSAGESPDIEMIFE